MWFVFISEQRVTFALYNISWMVFITKTKSVCYAVQPGSLNKTIKVRLKGLTTFLGNETCKTTQMFKIILIHQTLHPHLHKHTVRMVHSSSGHDICHSIGGGERPKLNVISRCSSVGSDWNQRNIAYKIPSIYCKVYVHVLSFVNTNIYIS